LNQRHPRKQLYDLPHQRHMHRQGLWSQQNQTNHHNPDCHHLALDQHRQRRYSLALKDQHRRHRRHIL
jgi:diadenosine tetraphosphatase ApaH/serine/threonine PP2A family protein phosphatase